MKVGKNFIQHTCFRSESQHEDFVLFWSFTSKLLLYSVLERAIMAAFH